MTVTRCLSLLLIVRLLLHVPVHGSVLRFIADAMLDLFFANAIRIYLGALARSPARRRNSVGCSCWSRSR